MAKAKAKTPRRPKQKQIPGMEDITIRAVEDAADNYDDCMHARLAKSKDEKESKDNLIAVMTENQIDRYKMPDGRIVMVVGKKNVSIKKADNGAVEE